MKWIKDNEFHYYCIVSKHARLDVSSETTCFSRRDADRWFGYITIESKIDKLLFDINAECGCTTKEKAMKKTEEFLKKIAGVRKPSSCIQKVERRNKI